MFLFFLRKKSDNSIVNSIVETSVPEFSGISPEFSTNQNFWEYIWPLCSTPPNGQRDINFEKCLQKKNVPFFQLSAPAISVASPLHWIIYVVNNNLKKSCLLHLRGLHNSNPTYLRFSRLENNAYLLKVVWYKTQDPTVFDKVNIRTITNEKVWGHSESKSGAKDIFPNAKTPACNFFQNHYQMLLNIFWPTAQTG